MGDELSGRRIEADTVALNESAHIERAVERKDDVVAFAIRIGLRVAADTDGEAMVVLTRLEVHIVVLEEEIDIAVELVIDEPYVFVSVESLSLRQGEGVRAWTNAISSRDIDAHRDIYLCRCSAEQRDTVHPLGIEHVDLRRIGGRHPFDGIASVGIVDGLVGVNIRHEGKDIILAFRQPAIRSARNSEQRMTRLFLVVMRIVREVEMECLALLRRCRLGQEGITHREDGTSIP